MLKLNTLKIGAFLLLSNVAFAQTLDPTFGTKGIADLTISTFTKESVNGMSFTNDNKIICVGSSREATNDKFIVARYLGNGQLDKTFNGTGFNAIDLGTSKDYGYDVVVLKDNSVVAVGYATNTKTSSVVVKFKADGTLDASFGTGGKLTIVIGNIDYGKAIVALSDGSFIVGGTTGGSPFLAKVKANGTIDDTWADNGIASISLPQETVNVNRILLDKSGKIVLVGDIDLDNTDPQKTASTDMFWARFNADGTLDGDFKRIGTPKNYDVCYDAILLDNGKLIMVGEKNTPGVSGGAADKVESAIVQLNADGTQDKVFTKDFGVGFAEAFRAVDIMRNGMIIAAGFNDKKATYTRFNLNTLTVDNSFGTAGTFSYTHSFRPDINRILINKSHQQIFSAGYSTVAGQGNQNFLVTKIISDLSPALEADANTIPLTAFPNPTANSLTISYQLGNESEVSVDLYDLSGKLVQHLADGIRSAAPQTESFELADVSAGIYICRINTQSGASNIRVNIVK
jgi:uncharacterized delta-60 repeat protein